MGETADPDTFDRLMREHLPATLRFAVRLTGNADTAEDVVQDALLRAARGWQTFRGQSSFRTWLIRIVLNTWHDHHSSQPPAGQTLEVTLMDRRGDDPLDLASATDLGERIAEFVSSLPPRQRETIVLTAYEGLSISEAAAVLGLSTQNFRTSLHLARQRLKDRLEKVMDVNRGTDRPTV